MASAIQSVGTLEFTISTGVALHANLSTAQATHHVWRPDAIGSACFLVASWLAWSEACHGQPVWRPLGLSWWITLLSMTGSVGFGVSAVASSIVPSTGALWSVEPSSLGTFIVSLCFLVGALLLLPERTRMHPV